MQEPAPVGDSGRAELVERRNAFRPQGVRVEPAESRRDETCFPGRVGETRESRAERAGEGLRDRGVASLGGRELERVVRAAAREVHEPGDLRRRERRTRSFEYELGEVALRQTEHLDAVGLREL